MVYIKNMDMPCNCWECGCTYEDYRGATVCIFTREPLYPMGKKTGRAGNCPLGNMPDIPQNPVTPP